MITRLGTDSTIERQILDYLALNPAARDTARGIAEWWLLKQRIRQTVAEVEAALTRLVRNGKLAVQITADGQVYFCLKQPRRRDRKPGPRARN